MRAPSGSLLIISISLVAVFGVLTLWTPFSIDQALFAYGARTILADGVLYLDFWDIKQPGIFVFYALAGKIFGLHEVGVHLAELVWLLGAAAALGWLARRCLRHPAAVALAPLASLGVYFVFAAGEHRTQVEALVVLPLALALAASVGLADRPHSVGLGLLLGGSAAIVGAFKLLYLAFPAAFFMIVAIALVRSQGERAGGLLIRIAAWSLLGLVVAWLPLVAYFVAHDALRELLWTSFGYPTETLQDVAAAPLARLQASSLWALGVYLGWLPLVSLGVVGIGRTRRWSVALGVALYLVLGCVLIFVQKTSWWEYHLVLLFPPLGLLAAIGLDSLLTGLRRLGWQDRTIAVVTTLVLLPALGSVALASAERARIVAEARAVTTDAALAVRLDPEYLEIWEGTRFLREAGWPGSLYVFGDPRILWLSGRRQSIPVHGHGWEHLPKRMWDRLPSELLAAEPAYVFVTDYNWELLQRRAPELREALERLYRPLRRLPRGRLLVRKRGLTARG